MILQKHESLILLPLEKREMIPNVSQIHCCTKTVCYSLRADDVGVSSPWHRDITRSELGK